MHLIRGRISQRSLTRVLLDPSSFQSLWSLSDGSILKNRPNIFDSASRSWALPKVLCVCFPLNISSDVCLATVLLEHLVASKFQLSCWWFEVARKNSDTVCHIHESIHLMQLSSVASTILPSPCLTAGPVVGRLNYFNLFLIRSSRFLKNVFSLFTWSATNFYFKGLEFGADISILDESLLVHGNM